MHKKLYLKIIFLVVWMIVIFLFSSEGHDVSSSRSDAVIHLIPHASHWSYDFMTFVTRKLAHSFNYLVLGILALNVVRDFVPGIRKALLLSVLFVALYAVSDEIHQIFVPGRGPLVSDVLIDTAAGIVGAILFGLFMKWRRRHVYLPNS